MGRVRAVGMKPVLQWEAFRSRKQQIEGLISSPFI